MKEKTYYQIFNIRRPFRDYKMLDEFVLCPLCKIEVQLCKIGMLRDFKNDWKRCSVCFVKIPLPQYIQAFLKRTQKKALEPGQLTL